MAGMSYLVYRCNQQPIGLVSTEYYNEELKYSDKMNKEKNTLGLDGDTKIVFDGASKEVVVTYPEMKVGSKISGEILFFKPDNSDFDFTVPVKVDANHLQLITTARLPKGMWRVKINWQAKDISYYNEEKIFIN
jgi:nitrogen fixation protein FixH